MKHTREFKESAIQLVLNSNEEMIRNYVKNQGKEYNKVYTGQLKFDL